MNTVALRDAWIYFSTVCNVSLDRMICSPELRGEFVRLAKEITGEDEEEILWNLLKIRKQGKLKED